MYDKYRIQCNVPVALADFNSGGQGEFSKGDDKVESLMTRDLATICTLQEGLYAEARQSVLVVLQGMDTSGRTEPSAISCVV